MISELITTLVGTVNLLIIAVWPLPLASHLIARLGQGRRTGRLEWLLKLFLWWMALQMLLGLALGSLGLLGAGPALLAAVVAGGCGAVLCHRYATWPASVVRRPFIARLPTISRPLRAIFALIAGVTLWQLWIALAVPMDDPDTLMYHMGNVARWISTGRFENLAQFQFTSSRYPAGWEVVAALFVLPFGSEFGVGLPMLAPWLAWGAAIVVLARQLGADLQHGVTAAALVMTMPLPLRHLNSVHVDIAFAALFTIGLVYALKLSRERTADSAAYVILATGLLPGVKVSAVAYVLLILATAGVAVAAGIRSRAPALDRPGRLPPLPWRWLWVTLAIAGTVAVYWYAKNWLEFGNPLGYVQIELGGRILFPGSRGVADYRRTAIAAVFEVTRAADWGILGRQVFEQLSTSFLALPAAIAAGRIWHAGHRPRMMLAGLATATLLLYVVTPFTGSALLNERELAITRWIGQSFRMGFPFISLLAAGAAVALAHSPIRSSHIAGAALLAVTLSLAAGGSGAALVIAAFLLGGWRVCARRWLNVQGPRESRHGAGLPAAWRAFLFGSLIVFLFGLLHGTRLHHDRARRDLYGGLIAFVDDHIPDDASVLYTLNRRAYLLYGSDLRGEVNFIDVRAVNERADFDLLIGGSGAHFFVVGPAGREWIDSAFLAWLDASMLVKPVFGSDPLREIVIYELVP